MVFNIDCNFSEIEIDVSAVNATKHGQKYFFTFSSNEIFFSSTKMSFQVGGNHTGL